MLTEEVTEKDHIQGNSDAPITLVEYGDYECPHCGRAHLILKRIQHRFGDQIRLVFRNFPLKQMHPMAEPAAETAEFAATQGKFWETHDAIFENQKSLSPEFLFELAERVGVSAEGLREALQTEAFVARVRHDFLSGVRSGVNGTPTFFINGQRHDASYEYDDLVAGIENAGAAGA
jgi:protein-disulfide isomerase